MKPIKNPSQRDRWARLRFSIVGPLLAAPAEAGDLQTALALLAAKTWRHPTSGLDVSFGLSTLERWYYVARKADDPVAALRNRLRGGVKRFPSLSQTVIDTLTQQYREHPGWTSVPQAHQARNAPCHYHVRKLLEATCVGRMVISGSIQDVCAELDRFAAAEAS